MNEFLSLSLLDLEGPARKARAEDFARQAPPSLRRIDPRRSFARSGDFVSEGDYWWPDPSAPNGLPFIRRDGESNPDAFIGHRLELRRFRSGLSAFAASWLDTGDARWAGLAATWIESFLVDPASRMNPHLRFAQGIPGLCTGRGIGVIDTLHLAEVPLALLALRPALPAALFDGARAWFAEYLAWMRTDPLSLEESREKNNHGTAWTFQVAAFERVVGDASTRTLCLERFLGSHLPDQMDASGGFPLELKRTKPYAYSIFNLDLFAGICRLLDDGSGAIFTRAASNRRRPDLGMAFLAPFLADKAAWKLAPDIEAWNDWPVRPASLLFFGRALRRADWLELWKSLPAESPNPEVRRHLFFREAVLWEPQEES